VRRVATELSGRILQAIRAVHEEIIAAVQAELRDANGKYTLMTQAIRGSFDDLKRIQARIDSIIVNTRRAADAVAAIAKVVAIAAKFFV
jgi:prophage DNA circulation protein